MKEYSTFTDAYRPENLNKEPRVSADVPQNLEEWKAVLNNTPIVVLYLWSEGCRPCLLIRDKYENMARELTSPYIRFFKDNIDKVDSIHRDTVEVVPTFFILRDGRVVDDPRHKGRFDGWSEELRESILFHLQHSRQYHESQQQRQSSAPPRFVCKNNICYIQNDS